MINKDYSLWYNQISIHKKMNRTDFGLTVPYLIGSYQICEQRSVSISLLLHDIIESDYEKCAVLQMCPDIHQYVIGLDDREFCIQFMKKNIQFFNSRGQLSLIISTNADKLGSNIDGVIQKFEELYSDQIMFSRFSWNLLKKEWIGFSEVETEIIFKGK